MSSASRACRLKLGAAGLTVLVLSGSGTAVAQQPPGLYVGVGLGVAVFNDTDGTVSGIKFIGETDPGVAASGAIGYRFGNGLRLEGEFLYSQANLKTLRFPGGSASLNGRVDLYTFTAGAFYDFTGYEISGTLVPYVGAGLGATHESAGNVTATVGGLSVTAAGGNSTDFTAFGEVGFAWAISQRIQMVPSYRFQWINDGSNGFDDTLMHVFRVGLRVNL